MKHLIFCAENKKLLLSSQICYLDTEIYILQLNTYITQE